METLEKTLEKTKKILSVDFVFGEKTYTAKFEDSKIYIFGNSGHFLKRNPKSRIANFDLETGKNYWYFNHCCGAQGFGQEITDKCYACETPGAVEENISNLSSLMVYSGFNKELSDFVKKDLRKLYSNIGKK
jgi:hypothetical protein